jgi:hypothetical protein
MRSQRASPGDRNQHVVKDQPRAAALGGLGGLVVVDADDAPGRAQGTILAASPAAARYAQENELGYLIFAVLFPTVGVVVAWHRPGNPIGWLFGLIGLLGAVELVGSGYAASRSWTVSAGSQAAPGQPCSPPGWTGPSHR